MMEMRRWSLAALLGALLSTAAPSRADEMLVVVETPDPRAADAIREGLGVELRVTVVTLADERSRRVPRTLAVSYDPGRRASVLYRAPDGRRYYLDVRADRQHAVTPERVVSEAVRLVRAAPPAYQMQTEVLDPFSEDPPPAAGSTSSLEVLDPWGYPPSGRRGPPPPVRPGAPTSTSPALRPPPTEPASRLGVPLPHRR
jgi:hypothetical protein